jgi:hypothetical protein
MAEEILRIGAIYSLLAMSDRLYSMIISGSPYSTG